MNCRAESEACHTHTCMSAKHHVATKFLNEYQEWGLSDTGDMVSENVVTKHYIETCIKMKNKTAPLLILQSTCTFFYPLYATTVCPCRE